MPCAGRETEARAARRRRIHLPLDLLCQTGIFIENIFFQRPFPLPVRLISVNTKKLASRKDIMKKEQLGQLIIASEDMMYHVAKTMLDSDADCADAIQETIVKAFTKLHTLRQDSYAKTWLVRILINECYAIMRREKRIVSLEEYQGGETAIQPQDYSDLYEALRQLPVDNRICVTLYYLEGYSVKETAKMLGITESAVKNRLARARNRMRSELEEAAT